MTRSLLIHENKYAVLTNRGIECFRYIPADALKRPPDKRR